jgi:hypothetical protein
MNFSRYFRAIFDGATNSMHLIYSMYSMDSRPLFFAPTSRCTWVLVPTLCPLHIQAACQAGGQGPGLLEHLRHELLGAQGGECQAPRTHGRAQP